MSTDEQPVEKSANSKRLILVLAAIGVSAFGGKVAFDWWTEGRFIEKTNNAFLVADQVVISPKLSGYLAEVLAEENQAVEAGDLLLRIDPGPYRAKLRSAEAGIAASEADLERTRSEILMQDSVIGERQAALRTAQQRQALVEAEADRLTALAEAGAGTEMARDAGLLQQAEAEGAVLRLQAELTAARARRTMLDAQIAQNLASLEAARARREEAAQDLAATEILAPKTGRVGNFSAEPGQFVQPGARLMTIVDIDSLYMEANFKETQVGKLKEGQPVRVRIDALGDQTFEGAIESLAPGTGAIFSLLPPENATGNFTKIVQRVPVRIRLDLPEEALARLAPGLSGEVETDTRDGRR